jgi:hypothetical protein
MQKTQTQIRMDDRMKERVRSFQAKFKKKTRAKVVTFSDAVRELLNQALDQAGIR